MGFDGDILGIHFRDTLKCHFDSVFDIDGGNGRLHSDLVGHASHANQIAQRHFRFGSLEVKLDQPIKSYPAFFHKHLDVIVRH